MAPGCLKSQERAAQAGGRVGGGRFLGAKNTAGGAGHLMTGSFWGWSAMQLVLRGLMGQPTTAMCTGMTEGGRSPTCEHTPALCHSCCPLAPHSLQARPFLLQPAPGPPSSVSAGPGLSPHCPRFTPAPAVPWPFPLPLSSCPGWAGIALPAWAPLASHGLFRPLPVPFTWKELYYFSPLIKSISWFCFVFLI